MAFSINAVTRRQIVLGALGLFGALTCSRAGHAVIRNGPAASGMVSRLIEHILQVIGSKRDGSSQERHLMAAIEKQTDLSLLARMTMGRYWRRANARQRERFVEIFRRYLLLSFTSRLRHFAGADLGPARDRFTIVNTKNVGKNDIVVRSRIEPPSGNSLVVDWRIRARDDRLFVIDLVVEGVSLLITQRSEFASVLERVGIDGLIGELRARVARMT